MKYILLVILFLILPSASAAHYIVGQVNDASDLTSANNRIITVWNPSNGISDNITDIIGVNGNSGTDNVYFVDCESLNIPCQIGDEIKAKVFDGGDGYYSPEINLTVSGAGFDLMTNITLTADIIFGNISLDDELTSPPGEIDLTPANTTLVSCQGVTQGPEMDNNITNITSEFFNTQNSFYGDSNLNKKHYTNSSCSLNIGYGSQEQVYFNCSYNIQYYSSPGNWNCTINVTKNDNITRRYSLNTTVNTLLALELPDVIDYGIINSTEVSSEKVVNVTNYGNSMMNLSLKGYALTPGDNLSMNCSIGDVKNISINYQKYNLTNSNSNIPNLNTFEQSYVNLSSTTVIRNFSLNSRQSDVTNDALRSTYWRIYVPNGVAGKCSGKVIFGATSSAGI